MNEDFGATLISLIDDEGNEQQFEIIDETEIDGENYAALFPYVSEDEELTDENSQVYLFKILEDGEGEIFATIEDDDEFEKVYAIFEDRLNNLLFDDED